LPLYEELEELEGLPPADFLVSVQYHRILRRHHIEKASILAINLHMAPLPEYRGCNQFSFAIVNGDGEFGTTIHELTEGVDAGGIISERRFPIPEGCYVEELFRITQDHSIALFEENLPLITAGEYKVVPQSEHLDSRKTSFHFRKDIEKLRRIDLDWPADRIVRHVRATAMPGFPPPYTIVDGVRIEFRIRDSDPAQGA
jgi:methionyl-tRNA formyltransferase